MGIPKIPTFLEKKLLDFLVRQRWFGGKARRLRSIEVKEAFQFESSGSQLLILKASFVDGPSELYLLPLMERHTDAGSRLLHSPDLIAAADQDEGHVFIDSSADEAFHKELLQTITRKKQINGWGARLAGRTISGQAVDFAGQVDSILLGREQSNTSIAYGKKLILKLFRKLQEGINPELEIGKFLAERGFVNTAGLVGWISIDGEDQPPLTVAILHRFVPNQGDAWSYALGQIRSFLQTPLTVSKSALPSSPASGLDRGPIPESVRRAIGGFLDSADLLGRRTAQMHLALEGPPDSKFAPEPLDRAAIDNMVRNALSLTSRVLTQLEQAPQEVRNEAGDSWEKVKNLAAPIKRRFERLRGEAIQATLIRCHGDYHLGQVLWTGQDFVIIDFEGEPMRTMEERRRKKSPLTDVAGMIRSFDYAAQVGVRNLEENVEDKEEKTDFWNSWAKAAFIKEYLRSASGASFLPVSPSQLSLLLHALILEKAIYELGYELNNRPTWVGVPLTGILRLMQEEW